MHAHTHINIHTYKYIYTNTYSLALTITLFHMSGLVLTDYYAKFLTFSATELAYFKQFILENFTPLIAFLQGPSGAIVIRFLIALRLVSTSVFVFLLELLLSKLPSSIDRGTVLRLRDFLESSTGSYLISVLFTLVATLASSISA